MQDISGIETDNTQIKNESVNIVLVERKTQDIETI